MGGNCLLVISKNEGLNPISIAKQSLNDSDVIDKVIISDGSEKENFQLLKKRETKDIEVIHEKKYWKTKQKGKGIGMINAGIAAIKQGYENLGFIDGDILNPNLGKWFQFLFNPLQRNIDIVKAGFSRHPSDAQITRHISKPLIAMFFPPAWEINQPLGGELTMTKNVFENLFNNKDIKPPYGWGIDTFITIKSLIHGFVIGEVYLGQKMHGKKDLTNLKGMFIQCLKEAIRLIKYYQDLKVRKKIKPITKISSPFKKNTSFKECYMDVQEEVLRSIKNFKLLRRLNIPGDNVFYKLKKTDSYRYFKKNTEDIDIDQWLNMLYWIVKKYSIKNMEQYYLRWKIRSLSYCIRNIENAVKAEEVTDYQAKTASRYLYEINETTAFDENTDIY
ncbi:MAG: glycosyltransferase family 2 protein [Candidatus Thermoplasmatota archaeon]